LPKTLKKGVKEVMMERSLILLETMSSRVRLKTTLESLQQLMLELEVVQHMGS
jgi:hypothetical protein